MEPLEQFQKAMNDILASGGPVSQPHEVVSLVARCLADEPDAFPALAAAAREEGAELERARIRDSNPFVFTGEYYVLPASLLAPDKENEK